MMVAIRRVKHGTQVLKNECREIKEMINEEGRW